MGWIGKKGNLVSAILSSQPNITINYVSQHEIKYQTLKESFWDYRLVVDSFNAL